jgi:hypothetical protein
MGTCKVGERTPGMNHYTEGRNVCLQDGNNARKVSFSYDNIDKIFKDVFHVHSVSRITLGSKIQENQFDKTGKLVNTRIYDAPKGLDSGNK